MSNKEVVGIFIDFREDSTIYLSFKRNGVEYGKSYPFATPPAEVTKIMRDLLEESGTTREEVDIEYREKDSE